MQDPLFTHRSWCLPSSTLSTSIAQCQRGPWARLWHPGGTGHITLSATVKGQLLKEVVSSGWSWIRPPVAPTCMYPGCDPGRVIMEQPHQAGTPYSAELSGGLGSDFHFSSETAHLQGNEPTFSLLPPGQASQALPPVRTGGVPQDGKLGLGSQILNPLAQRAPPYAACLTFSASSMSHTHIHRHAYTQIHIHTGTHTLVHTHRNAYTAVDIQRSTHRCTHTDRYTQVHTQVHTQRHTQVHTYRCTHRCTHTNVHTDPYTPVQIHRCTYTDVHTSAHTHRSTHTGAHTEMYTQRSTHTDAHKQMHT